MLSGGAKNFVDEMGDCGFSGGSGDADEFHVANRVSVIGRKEFGAGALSLSLEGNFWFSVRFRLREILRIFHG